VVAGLGPAENPQRETHWTTPYEDAVGRGAVMTAHVPVYIADEYRGTISVDLSLARLVSQLDAVKPTASGFAFYIDADGALLPSAASPAVQRAIDEPGNEGVANALAGMREGRAGVERVRVNGREAFVAYAPFGNIGGSLGVAAPIDEIAIEAEAVRDAINEGSRDTLILTLLIMAAFFLVALAGAAYMNRRLLLQPIGALVAGTRSVASGNLTARIDVRSDDEMRLLADSFNDMTAEMAASRGRLEERNRALEAEVAQRERIEAEMRKSEQLYRTLARNLPNGAVVLFDHDLRYVIADGGGLAGVGLSSEAMEGRTIFELFPPEVTAEIEPPYRRAHAGESVEV
jgi:PAS domain-containing protein